ncbi:hypothetical protein GINT2_002299 [Glugoides intestinalis]
MHLSFFTLATLLKVLYALLPEKRHCLVDIEAVRHSKGYVPTVATSYNLPEILDRMKKCHITTVQVAGWDNHVGVYVVYSNGAVVPAIPQNLPSVILYTKLCGKMGNEFVFVTENCKFPENPKLDNNSLKPQSLCCYEQPVVTVTQNIGWNQSTGFVNCEESSDRGCFPIPAECSRKRKGHNSRRQETLQYTTVYRFADKVIDKRLTKVLIAETKAEKNSTTVYDLKKARNLPVTILKDYKYLKFVYNEAVDRFSNDCCLYVNNSSQIFVLSDNELYHILGKDQPLFKKLDMRQKENVISCGLQLVIID